MFNSTSPKTGSGCEGTQGETGNEILTTVKACTVRGLEEVKMEKK